MIEFSRLTVLILAELLIGLGFATLVLVSMAVIRRRKAYQAAQHLIERIRRDDASRSERLRRRLTGHYGYQGEVLEQTLHDLNRIEKRLYQNIINGFLKRDLVAFQQVDLDVDNLVLAYQGLEAPLSSESSTDKTTTASDRDEAEIDRLQADNQRLSDELKITMDTMARMISEYAAMFSNEMGGYQDEQEVMLTGDPLDAVESRPQARPRQGVDQDTPAGVDEVLAGSVAEIDFVTGSSGDGSASKEGEVPANLEAAVAVNRPSADEVLEVADDFSDLVVDALSQPNESDPEPQGSLVDDLARVDLNPADLDQGVIGSEAEPGSLEEEWAKLLEEETRSAEGRQRENRAGQRVDGTR